MGNLTVKESGEMASFISPNVSNITSFKVHFSPRQEGSGDPSPENVREIVGWNGVEGYISNVAQPYSSTSNTLTAMIDWTEDIGTIYGGYVDLISGELVETHYMEYLTKTTEKLNAGYNSETKVFFRCPLTYTGDSTNFVINELQCDKLKSVRNPIWSSSESFINTITTRHKATNKVCMNMYKSVFNITDEDSLNDMQHKIDAYLQENPIQVSYKMETPITHQLTPQQLSTFKGQNNFWSNADYVEIEYELTETFDIQKAKRKIILNQPHVESASGDIVTFDTDMKGKLKECKIYFSPVQEGEGDPSPDNVRNITGWNGVSVGLPSEYQEVEYIEKSILDQYIDTGILGNGELQIDCKINISQINNGAPFFGSYGKSQRCYFLIQNNNGNAGYSYITSVYGSIVLEENIDYYINTIFNSNEQSLYINNELIRSENTTRSLKTDKNIYLFGYNFDGTFDINRSAIFKLYYFKLYQNGTLVRNLIPCYRKSDNEIGMYDTVSKQFFTNQGTGTFLKGDDVDGIQASIDWTDDVGTVYGGYVDLVSGELVEEWYSITFDGENVKVNKDYTNSSATDTDYIKAYLVYFSPTGISTEDCKCDTLKITYYHKVTNIPQTPCLYLSNNGASFGGLILGKKEDYPELAEGTSQDRIDTVNNWFKENPTQVIYKLKTPIIHQLTPQQILTLKGTNNIYSDTNGQTEIKYWKH